MRTFIPFLGAVSLITLIVFGLLKWIGTDPGHYLDWVIGLLSVWWLALVTTIPWNLYFKAKELLRESKISEERQIRIRTEDRNYLAKACRNFLTLALALHLVSALTFFILAQMDVTGLGNWLAILALALIALRPLIRLYRFILHRLKEIGRNIHYPREDLYSLLERFRTYQDEMTGVKDQLKALKEHLAQPAANTFLGQQKMALESLEFKLDACETADQQLATRMDQMVQKEVVTLVEDQHFIQQVQQFIRFIKQA